MKSIKEYLSRIGKSRGFGIQSPWAYSFVRDVIMEELPYYAYTEIEENNTRQEQKWQKLFFRIRNFVHGQPFRIISFLEFSDKEIEDVLYSFNGNGVLIIRKTDQQYDRWLRFRDSDSVGITFDLYYNVICFPANNMYKQHYKLNF